MAGVGPGVLMVIIFLLSRVIISIGGRLALLAPNIKSAFTNVNIRFFIPERICYFRKTKLQKIIFRKPMKGNYFLGDYFNTTAHPAIKGNWWVEKKINF